MLGLVFKKIEMLLCRNVCVCMSVCVCVDCVCMYVCVWVGCVFIRYSLDQKTYALTEGQPERHKDGQKIFSGGVKKNMVKRI